MKIEQQIAALWGSLSEKWKYIAIDGNGMICAYTHPPVKSGSVWEPGAGEYRRLQMVQFPEVVYDRLQAPEYSTAERDCPGCMGPCGRCEAPAYTAEQLREMSVEEAIEGRAENSSALYEAAMILKKLQKQQP